MITQKQIQSIVDGECSHESRALLLQAMETQPSTWRSLALALLEEQQWSKQISSLSKGKATGQIVQTASDSSLAVVAASSISARVQPLGCLVSPESLGCSSDGASKKFVPWLSALAAGLLLGLGFYGGSILPSLNTIPSEVGGTATTISSLKNEAVPFDQYLPLGNTLDTEMRMLVSGPNREKSEIPIYDLNALDHDVFVAKENYEVAKINQRLRREGFELDVRPEYYTGTLNDGRQLIVPVKHVGLKPYGL
jgi:hypothetical protein